MKNFFKKLAFVMALAMVITSLAPAGSVFAASKPALNAKSATLLLGNKKRASFDFNLNNKVKGSTYKWTTSNKKVATVAQNGVVKAVSNGTATIKLAIKLPTNKTTTLSATVTVKTNATSVELTNVPTAAIKVGETVNFNRSYKTLPGTKTTDVTKFVITSENAAKAKITKNGFFTATEPGEYTVQALMAQSTSKMNAGVYTAKSEEVKVTVKASIASVTQINGTSFKVTFDSAVTGDLKDFSLAEVVGTAKVTRTLKSVKFDDAKKVATVTSYVPFAGGSTYTVSYTDMDSKEFIAATTKVEDVTSVEIVNKQITFGEPKELEIKLLNKDGVDITTTSLLNQVTLEMTAEGDSRANLNGKTLIIFNKNESVVVTATFHTYKYDNTTGKEIGNIVTTSVITGVEQEVINLTGDVEYTIITPGTSADFNKANQKIAANDAPKQLVVRIKDSKGNYVSSESVATSKFTFESSNPSVLIADANGILHPVKVGSVVVVVKYGDKAVGAINITVAADRVVATLELSTYHVALSNSPNVTDTKEVAVTLKDQLGDTITEAISIKQLSNQSTNIAPLTAVNGKFTLSGVGANAGDYSYIVSSKNASRVITVTVTAPTNNDVKYYALDLSTAKLDTKVKSGDSTRNITIGLNGLASNYVKNKEINVTGAGFVVEITNPDGNVIDTNNNGTFAATTVSGGAITKAKTGRYTVTAYSVNSSNVKTAAVATEYFTIVDTQVAPVLTEVKQTISTKSSVLDAIRECLVVKFNGNDVAPTLNVGEITGTDAPGNTVYVKNVKYTENFADGKTIEHTITVNQYIKLK